jgi:hypothetical protein
VLLLAGRGGQRLLCGKPWWLVSLLYTAFISYEIRTKGLIRYTSALRQKPTAVETQIIKCNRSLTYLKTGQLYAALTDTEFSDFGSQPLGKALFRAAEARYQLQRF